MKTIIQIGLAIVILVLVYFIYDSIMEPVRFNQEVARREAMIVQRLKDIRQVQVAHRSRYGLFNSDLDSLVQFVKNDSLAVIRAIGSVPDTLTETEAVRLGIVQRDTIWVRAKDSLLTRTRYPIDSLPYVPFTDGKRFEMDAGKIERGLTKIPVFEAIANPRDFMKDIDRWRVYYTRDIEAGLRVGSMIEASIDGNWE
ncbi:MAG: hypothetical protein EA393_08965 [Bacteroidetes bacterium]|nr:MAG: hypothetical protein EA393_08965 [Bacteroidota bacterium]